MKLGIDNLSFSYRQQTVLHSIDFTVSGGELVCLVGPNGAGKSTLIKCINQILKPCSGRVEIDGTPVNRMGRRQIASLFGYVPQTARHAFPATLFDTVLLGRRPFLNWTIGDRNRDMVYEVLVEMGLDHLALRYFDELSGGEQQKTLIARALLQTPKVLLLDEPTSSLDLFHQMDVMDRISAVAKSQNICAVMAIHDLNLAALYADRMIFLKSGTIVRDGPPAKILSRQLVRSVYGVNARVGATGFGPHIIPIPSRAEPMPGTLEERLHP